MGTAVEMIAVRNCENGGWAGGGMFDQISTCIKNHRKESGFLLLKKEATNMLRINRIVLCCN